ncbi:MAG: hypothetical protein J3Q66DRAFT_322901 [Benniella sp.]|nr:MAG: hypothetical protein J3Q66DRAFT_322901 [Benniella sp.]
MKVNPMNMPEIITLVGRSLPLWKYSERLGFYDFNPKTLISCALVNKTWYHSLIPVIWCVYNGSVMRSIPRDVIAKNSRHFRILFYDRSLSSPFESRQLKELIIPWCDDKLVPLVEANAETLQTLAWKGSTSPSSSRETTLPMLDYDLFMRMAPTLQELQLSHWSLSGQDFVKFLAACRRLRSLCFAAIDWINPVPWASSNSTPMSSPLCSPLSSPSSPMSFSLSATDSFYRHREGQGLTHLRLDISVPKAGAFADLVRSCPDLESFSLYSESSDDARTLIPILREYCPNLTSIEYVTRFSSALNGYDFLTDSEFSDLVLSARGLQSLKVDVPWLNDAMTKALILQSSTLTSLELRFFKRRDDPMTDAENISNVLKYCTRLRKLSLFFSPHALGREETLRLFEEPWGCMELEVLELTDITTTTATMNTTTTEQSTVIHDAHNGGPSIQPYQRRIAPAPRPIPIPIESSRRSCGIGCGHNNGHGSLAKQKLFEQVRKLPKLAKLSLNHITYSVDGNFGCTGGAS